MADKEKILAEFDSLAKAKKSAATNVRLCLIFALVVILLVLIWAFRVTTGVLDKVIVVDRSGEYLQISSGTNEELFYALVKNTCSQVTFLANSFDKTTIGRNQAHASFYANQDDLDIIFAKYFDDRAYADALQSGTAYKCEFEQLLSIEGVNEPHRVEFTSALNIYPAGGGVFRFRVHTTGEIIRTTPQFPENVTGFFFNKIEQTIERIEGEEESSTTTG